MEVYHSFMFCCALFYVPSSFAIILMGKRGLACLLSLSSWYLVTAICFVVFLDHTHLLFLYFFFNNNLTFSEDRV